MRSPADLLFDGIGRRLSRVAAAADPDLPDLLCESEGRTLALVVRGTGRVLEVEVRDGSLRVRPPRRLTDGEYPRGPAGELRAAGAGPPSCSGASRSPDPDRDGGEASAATLGPDDGTRDAPEPEHPDLLLAGSVPGFVRFLLAIRRDGGSEDPFAGLEVRGAAAARDAFVALLRRVDPDCEALLARATGGVVAHAIVRAAAGRRLQAHRSAERLVDDLAEYLEEEARLVPDPAARARFASGVRALLGKAAELEGRLDRAHRSD